MVNPGKSIPARVVLHVSPPLMGSAAVSEPVVTTSPVEIREKPHRFLTVAARYAKANRGESSTFAPPPFGHHLIIFF